MVPSVSWCFASYATVKMTLAGAVVGPRSLCICNATQLVSAWSAQCNADKLTNKRTGGLVVRTLL